MSKSYFPELLKFRDDWFKTGTPTFQLLKHSRYDLHRLNEEVASAESLGEIDTMYSNPVPILYQSGYLTSVLCNTSKVFYIKTLHLNKKYRILIRKYRTSEYSRNPVIL